MLWVWGKNCSFNIHTTVLICEYVTTHSYRHLVSSVTAQKDSVSNSCDWLSLWAHLTDSLKRIICLQIWQHEVDAFFFMVFVLILSILPFYVSSHLVQKTNSQLNTQVQKTLKIKNENFCLLTRGTALSWISKFVSSSSPYCIW